MTGKTRTDRTVTALGRSKLLPQRELLRSVEAVDMDASIEVIYEPRRFTVTTRQHTPVLVFPPYYPDKSRSPEELQPGGFISVAIIASGLFF
jgi:hypothetical protein